ncbi:hypothetical protein BDV19DRAFT_76107 [Aspergillus venezuelensis]
MHGDALMSLSVRGSWYDDRLLSNSCSRPGYLCQFWDLASSTVLARSLECNLSIELHAWLVVGGQCGYLGLPFLCLSLGRYPLRLLSLVGCLYPPSLSLQSPTSPVGWLGQRNDTDCAGRQDDCIVSSNSCY